MVADKIASAGNRPRINCLEGNYAYHYTTDATILNDCRFGYLLVRISNICSSGSGFASHLYLLYHRVIIIEGPSPPFTVRPVWCVYLINFLIRNLVYCIPPCIYRIKPNRPSSRCNVHNESPPLNLMKFTTLDRSILYIRTLCRLQ